MRHVTLTRFHPAVASWFETALGAPTPCQTQAWDAVAARRHTLIAAPTGSGKTLAGFLTAIDTLVRDSRRAVLPDATRVVYVSPLKALGNDVHKNLEVPLAGIDRTLADAGEPGSGIRAMVRTGDTPGAAREAMRRQPPHILVTTPESLYILLTSGGGRAMLAGVGTVIVDEIHAVAGNKRGAHLALSLERLDALAGRPLTRIGLSATQRPIETVAHFLTGCGEAGRPRECTVVDTGHRRERDLALELPESPLEAVMSGEVWGEVYRRLCALIEAHRTTLVFVNTRRMAERVARALTDSLGEEHVTSHHGSLARERRLAAEQRLKAGDLKVLVATASLELGIDIGDVDLVCQLGSTRSIATFLQRAGRSGHAVSGTPKARLFPLTRDELVECAAILDAVRRGELDRLHVPSHPLDVLAQQAVAMVAAEDWSEEALLATVRRAYPYRNLTGERWRALLAMLAGGFATRRGRRSAWLHRDVVNGELRARRGARLTAMTSGGAIPDNADYDVVLEPHGTRLGSLNEDFAIESLPGDIFQLGNTSWRILRIERGAVRVEDAQGLPPNIPFWFGEAPGRTAELSESVCDLLGWLGRRFDAAGAEVSDGMAGGGMVGATGVGASGTEAAGTGTTGAGMGEAGAVRAGATGTGMVGGGTTGAGTDETGVAGAGVAGAGMVGVRTDGTGDGRCRDDRSRDDRSRCAGNARAARARAGRARRDRDRCGRADRGLPLRRARGAGRAAGPRHGGAGALLRRERRDAARHPLALRQPAQPGLGPRAAQAFLPEVQLRAPGGGDRGRDRALARREPQLRARRGLPLPLAGDGARRPDPGAARRPDVRRALALERERLAGGPALPGREQGPAEHPAHAGRGSRGRRIPRPDRLCREPLRTARDPRPPPGGADDRRRADRGDGTSRGSKPSSRASRAGRSGSSPATSPSPPRSRRRSSTPAPMRSWTTHPWRNAAPGRCRCVAGSTRNPPPTSGGSTPRRSSASARKPGRRRRPPTSCMTRSWCSASPPPPREWPGAWRQAWRTRRAGSRTASAPDGAPTSTPSSHPAAPPASAPRAAAPCSGAPRNASPCSKRRWAPARADPPLVLPEELRAAPGRDAALVELLRARLGCLGPATAARLARDLGLAPVDVEVALVALEAEGCVLRGRFTEDAASIEWCDRRLLARIHCYTLGRLRREIEPATRAEFMRYLFEWQQVRPDDRRQGFEALAAVAAELEGFAAPAAAWEAEILPARIADFAPEMLDRLCLAGRASWARPAPPNRETPGRSFGPIRSTPIALLSRRHAPLWLAPAAGETRGTAESSTEPGAMTPGRPARPSSGNGTGPSAAASTGARNAPTPGNTGVPRPSPPPGPHDAHIPGNGVSREATVPPASHSPRARNAFKRGRTDTLPASPPSPDPQDAHALGDAGGPPTPPSHGTRDASLPGNASAPPPSLSPGARNRPLMPARPRRVVLRRRPTAGTGASGAGRGRRALGELITHGLVSADGFAGLRAFTGSSAAAFMPSPKPAGGPACRAAPVATWRRTASGRDGAETIARARCCAATGVVFKTLLARESITVPWRDLLRVLRRLEARGEIRGGRFVAGFTGEQYALPEAVETLRRVRRIPADGAIVALSAADPLNLTGIVTLGDRIPAHASASPIAFRDGVPVATLTGAPEVSTCSNRKLRSRNGPRATPLLRRRMPTLSARARMREQGWPDGATRQ